MNIRSRVLEGSLLSQGTHPPLFVFCALSPLAAVAMCPNSRTSPLLLGHGQALPAWDKSLAQALPGAVLIAEATTAAPAGAGQSVHKTLSGRTFTPEATGTAAQTLPGAVLIAEATTAAPAGAGQSVHQTLPGRASIPEASGTAAQALSGAALISEAIPAAPTGAGPPAEQTEAATDQASTINKIGTGGRRQRHGCNGAVLFLYLLLGFLCFFLVLHASLQRVAREKFEEAWLAHAAENGLAEWWLLARAGIASQAQRCNASQARQVPGTGRGSFLLVPGIGPHAAHTTARTWVIPFAGSTWLECIRIACPAFETQTLSGTFTLGGKDLAESYPLLQLRDRTVRLRQYMLPGGMPAPDFAAMRKAPLMEEARRLGVPTREPFSPLFLSFPALSFSPPDRGSSNSPNLLITRRVVV